MRGGFAGQNEIAACVLDRRGPGLTGEQIVAQEDRAEVFQGRAMAGQPAFSALRSQSCFSAPSWGAMNSGGKGRTCWWPGATMLAPRKAWKYSVPPSDRLRVEQRGQWILRDVKCSVPSRGINIRPPRRLNGSSTPSVSMA